jgi:threonine aldolase
VEPDLSPQEEQALRESCTRFLYGHGVKLPADLLAELPDAIAPDRYGDGGVVAELEDEVATLLGKPAAAFLPSGTMAQQIALRVHADRRGTRTVVFHPTCHLDLFEGKGFERLHGLVGRPAGDATRLLSLDDLREVAEPPAVLLLELPQREIGGQLPSWDELTAQLAWARERGAALHMDGARLWSCGPFYERTLAEIAAPFDTVYVSFYKQLGGITGCCLVGPEDALAQAREWRRRHGGTLYALWPYAASALSALRRRLPSMPRYVEHGRAIAAAIGDLPGVEVVPDPPPAGMMHLLLHAPADRLRTGALRLAREERIWTWPRPQPTASPGVQEVELEVGDATLRLEPGEVRDVLERLLGDRPS